MSDTVENEMGDRHVADNDIKGGGARTESEL